MMTQPVASAQPAPSTPAAAVAAAPVTAPGAQPGANVTRSDNVIGGTSPTNATTTQPGTATPTAAPSGPAPSMLPTLMMFVLIGGFIFMLFWSQRRETKRRTELMAGLQRNDKVQTMGGIIGSIAEIDNGEVVLKTDEATNTRIRVSKAAISQVLNRSGAAKA